MIIEHSDYIAQKVLEHKADFGLVVVYDNLIQEFSDDLPLFGIDVDESNSIEKNVMDERYKLIGLAVFSLEGDLSTKRAVAVEASEKLREFIEGIRLNARSRYDVNVTYGYDTMNGMNVMVTQFEITVNTN